MIFLCIVYYFSFFFLLSSSRKHFLFCFSFFQQSCYVPFTNCYWHLAYQNMYRQSVFYFLYTFKSISSWAWDMGDCLILLHPAHMNAHWNKHILIRWVRNKVGSILSACRWTNRKRIHSTFHLRNKFIRPFVLQRF